ncbi:MAG: sulfatase [Verrucomicrobiota bacterium]|nr:sulfatase [Verrucomicrobiota bacterium]
MKSIFRRPADSVVTLSMQLYLVSVLIILTCCAPIRAEQPNILWLFCDDMAVNGISAYDSRFSDMKITPNIDRIAEEGVRFERCYVSNSVCAPSRATLLTGKHSHKNGKYGNIEPYNHDQMQFQKLIGQGGYQSAIIGKTHLPGLIQGFDYWETLPGHGLYENPVFITAEGRVRFEGHSSDVIADRALNWYNTKRDPEKPFILMVHFKAPHRDWTPASRFVEAFKEVTFPEPDTLFDNYATRERAAAHAMGIGAHMKIGSDLKADHWPQRSYLLDENLKGKALIRAKYQAYMRDYFACVAGVDENVGRLVQQLKNDGLYDNTIVMFSSDQGFYLGEHGWFDKRWMYEESFRTPFIAKWKGVIEPNTVNKDLAQNIDFAPTFLDIAGVAAPGDMQGESLVPLFEGQTPDDWRTSLYYHYYMDGHGTTRHEGVSDGNFKFIRFYGRKTKGEDVFELYDLNKDPAEMNNVYGNPEMAKKLAEMKAELALLKDYYDVPDEEVVMMKREKKDKSK